MLLKNLTNPYWSRIINLIIQRYLIDTTICILWNDQIEFELSSDRRSEYGAVISIARGPLRESFERDIEDFARKREQLRNNGLIFDELVEKLTMSIERSHCESFLAFQEDIPKFANAFSNASQYSIWRSMRNKFVFGYNREYVRSDYFSHYLFEDQPNLLLIEIENSTSTIFKLKTNKFVGKRSEQPSEMYLLNSYDAAAETFQSDKPLFPDKTRDLMGREVVLAAFDYRPYIVLDYDFSNIRDLAFDRDSEKGAVLLDGTESRLLMTFCEKYNCTVQLDTSEATDWGVVYPNISGDGALGMVAKRKAEISVGAMYSWHVDYVYLDMSMYLVRSGITCLVPSPKRLTSWLLPLEPFQPTLWAAVIVCLAVEVAGLFFTGRFEHTLASEGEKRSWFYSFKFAYVTTLKLFVSQSSNDSAKSISVRVLLFACFLNDIIITSIYGGGLASILTIPSLEEAADTLDRMLSQQLKWAANSEAWVMTIRGTDDPRMDEILENFHIYTNEEMGQLALKESMGFTLERLPFGHFAIEDFLTHTIMDRLKIMLDDLYFQYTVAFVSRLWPHLERFNNLIYMWHSSGFDKYWEWKIVADFLDVTLQKQVEASMYTNFDDIGPVKLGMSNFAGILLVWMLGIVLSGAVFLWEVIGYRMKQRKKQKVFDWQSA